MPYGLYISAEGAKAQQERLDVIANNMANVNTVGFKPDTASFQARFAEAIQQGSVAPGSATVNDIGGGVKVIETSTNYSPGRLQQTKNPGDLAIVGNGFFQVQGPNDQTLLTRAGSFRLDSQGRLMTTNGHQVLEAGGAPIQLAPNLPWSVTNDGYVEQGGGAVPLALVEPDSLDDLHKVGANLFETRGEVTPVEEAGRDVRPGFLEMSGANPTEQMMAMIETSRAFEANARMIQTQDSIIEGLVGRLLRVA